MKPVRFDPDQYLDCVEAMINSDEVTFALTMLDNMPAHYRDNVPDRAKGIRIALQKNIMSIYDYADDEAEYSDAKFELAKLDIAKISHQPRGEVFIRMVKALNAGGQAPHIFEMAPANYWLPLGLMSCQCSFQYDDLNFNSKAKAFIKAKDVISFSDHKDAISTKIFTCMEVIEHLWRPEDIPAAYRKYHNSADIIILSTPNGVMGGGAPEDWKVRSLGHIRTWTPGEFMTFAKTHFQEFNWAIIDDGYMMVLTGTRQLWNQKKKRYGQYYFGYAYPYHSLAST